ncbi:sulfotransferase [Pseudomonas cavernicola]|uniref:Sulfotransferase n=1 Tax=Pseudomonas cavernicola TaxID=2320866 RepID=A0A418X9G5_9PSED|nr:sulfotransferase [Pseudomonas cavernicola]RJG09111.1 sulfotransferase [Pseudomonas cavernicola]
MTSHPSPTPEFDVDSLLAQASARAGGLSDFGPGNYREALQVMFDSLRDEAGLSAQGRALLHEKLLGQLANRLVIEDYCRRYPEIEQQPLDDPLVIVGLPRTGTTLLQRTLAVDPQFHSAAWWETRYPAPLPGESLDDPAQRTARACAEVASMLEYLPQILAIHPLDALQADEEFMLMEHSFMSALDSYANVPSYTAWLDRQDQTPVYDYLKKMLQFLQWQQRRRGRPAGRRWLLKSPQHLHTLELLFKTFPRAQVILTHREPGKTIPSIASFVHTLWQMYSDSPDPRLVGAQWSTRMARAIRHSMEVRDGQPAECFLDVRFEDTLADPLAVIERIYRFAGLPLGDDVRAAMADWLAQNGREKRAAHGYSLAQFGLSERQLEDDYADYRARHLNAETRI